MTRLPLLALIVSLVVTERGLAQTHADCASCHAPHSVSGPPRHDALCAGENADALLKTPECLALFSMQELSRQSLSCLRCHATPETRDRERAPDEIMQTSFLAPTYLGDLRNDHPLAGSGFRRIAPRAVTGFQPYRTRWIPSELTGDDVPLPECTTCHGVHIQEQLIPDEGTQRRVCTGCHDPARYFMRGHTDVACSECHDLHGGMEEVLLREVSSDVLCRSCHDPASVAGPAPPGRTAALIKDVRTHLQQPDVVGKSCLGCHLMHQ